MFERDQSKETLGTRLKGWKKGDARGEVDRKKRDTVKPHV